MQVLVPIDATMRCASALRRARRLRPEATLLALHVLPQRASLDAITGIEDAARIERARAHLVRWLAKEELQVDGVEVVIGAPAAAILREATQRDCSLIVMAARTREERFISLGSTTHAVVRRSTVPVWVDRQTDRPPDTPRWLVAVDLFRQPESVVLAARDLARDVGARLDLLYVQPLTVLDSPWVSRALRHDVEQAKEKHALVYDSHMAALRDLLPPEQQGTASWVQGVVVDTLLDKTRSHDAVVLGTHGRAGVMRLWMGSVAERVVAELPLPAVVVPL